MDDEALRTTHTGGSLVLSEPQGVLMVVGKGKKVEGVSTVNHPGGPDLPSDYR